MSSPEVQVNLPWELAKDEEGIRQQVLGLLGSERGDLVSKIVSYTKEYGDSGRLTVTEALKALQRAQMEATVNRVGLTDEEVQVKKDQVTQEWVEKSSSLFS